MGVGGREGGYVGGCGCVGGWVWVGGCGVCVWVWVGVGCVWAWYGVM